MSASTVTSNPAPTPVVKVQNLTVYRGRYQAVRDVSFELYPGTSTAIVGPNGSGKSTLVQAILDIIPRSTGRVELLGQPLARLGPLRQQIGYMPQNFIFDRNFPISVAELVGLGWTNPTPAKTQAAKFKRALPWSMPEKHAAVRRSLQRVNADHLRRQAIGTLSGGEMKRVLLAYCLVARRRLLVLDEAFAEIDIQGEAAFHDLLQELRIEEGWTLLQVSHDLDMVSHTCDQILCMNQTLICSGRPETALSPENLLATYGSTFARYHHHH